MDIETQVVEMAVQSRQAARKMASVSGGQKEKMLLLLAGLIEEQSGDIVAANARDVEQAKKSGLDEARVDRLRLTPAGVQAMNGHLGRQSEPALRRRAPYRSHAGQSPNWVRSRRFRMSRASLCRLSTSSMK